MESLVVKSWANVVLHHMLDSKRKNITLPYAELNTKILTYIGYEFREEEPDLVHTKIGKKVIRKMGFSIQEGKLVPQPPRRARQRRNNNLSPSSSNTLIDIQDEKKEMNTNIDKLFRRMEKRNPISPMVSSKDVDDDEMN